MAKSHFYVSVSKFKNVNGNKQKRQFVEWKEIDASSFPNILYKDISEPSKLNRKIEIHVPTHPIWKTMHK